MSALVELIAVCAVLGIAALVATRRQPLGARVAVLGVAALLWVGIALRWRVDVAAEEQRAALASHRPADLVVDASSPYAGSGACRACHPREYATWRKSFHRTMTQAVTPETVRASFDDVELSWDGRVYRAFREGERFFVDLPRIGTKGARPEDRIVRPVVMSTGSHHQQLFWYPLREGDPAVDEQAQALYAERCARCHGAEAAGGEAPALALRELLVPRIERALAAPKHLAEVQPPLAAGEHEAIVALVMQMQTMDRLMQFPFSWLIEDGRWVHEGVTFLGPPDRPQKHEPYDQGWSFSCDGCHAVGARFERGGLGEAGRAAAVELGISCEACHGAGARHVARHQNPLTRYAAHDDGRADDIVNPARLDPARAAGVCGQCHGETQERDDAGLDGFRPGARLEDHLNVVHLAKGAPPAWLAAAVAAEPDLIDSGFWGDGTIRIAGRDYNGLIETACHSRGELTCGTCHEMHGDDPNDQLRPTARTGAICNDCHAAIAADVTAHTHHPEGSSGSDCYNCHMPHTTWGLLGAMRAHRITSPSAETARTTGRPSACNLCHLDKPMAWTADALARWYGHEPRAVGPPTPERALPDDVSAAVVWALRGDGVQRGVVAWHFGWAPAAEASGTWWMPAVLGRALDDSYTAVRYVAGHSLARVPGYEGFAYDFVAAPAALTEARRRALASFDPGDHGPLPAVLIGPAGPDTGRLRALEVLRDHRPVSVNE
jgi:hypothetical protein